MYGLAAPTVQQMIRNPGYSDAAKGTMRRDAFGATTNAFDAAEMNARNRAAATGNAAGFNELQSELARSKGRELSDTAGRLDTSFEQEAQRQREGGLGAAQNLYGVSQDTMKSMYGLGPSTLTARQASAPGWTDKVANLAGAASGVRTAFCWIAATVFGEDLYTGPRVNLCRRWLIEEFEPSGPLAKMVMALYRRQGERIARMIGRSATLRRPFRALFDRVLAKAQARYGRA